MVIFLITHHNYNYDELCLELENSHRHEVESPHEFLSIFLLIFHRFCKDDQPYGDDLFELFLYILHVY